ncbi:HepT-like ribonuclease domain-containing protein [Azospirillum sp.]|uniref:HepT-like ribonuclease domain-containing protein n=1 Tax=Azospirillum sp. TaxID=34012 RepID=UPI003D757F22
MPSEDVARRLRDILDNIERIRRHMDGLSLETFLDDEKTQDAVERCLERIAEAARKIGDVLDTKHPGVEFHKLRQFGSVLRHDYDGVDADLVWIAATKRLPLLEAACRTELDGA